MPVLDGEALRNAKILLKEYFDDNKARYYALLNYEGRDFTVFNIARFDPAMDERAEDIVLEILMNRGSIHLIDYQDETRSTVDCWIVKDGEPTIYKLFDYDWGVIECG